ncbi:pilus assembly FimT family protein [Candidatus Stoquefichus massiliensis]|uniref:pilus assembly FimT family protein n=1 Tax=Candidatus Stoquefichus massiliensis TaxID=1470350 RepID=UPI00048514C4|nr:prepilin-type N-terminal cleavage/methylation domain-containing protein [Candidatus Stoquefichus massiliensis]
MHKDKNKKNGFTLVEIIVSIAIFSALLAVLGSIMISGFKYFYETSSTDLDKRTIDEIASYVRSELLYATEVRVQETKPDGTWRSFSVVDGKLHQYEETDLASTDLNLFSNDSFYNNHSFKMTSKAYEDKNRLDLTFIMYDDKEDLYTTHDTLELLNVSAVQSKSFAEALLVGKDDLKIYYKKDKITVGNSELSGDRTVADRIKKINMRNNRGYFTYGRHYSPGDYVFYNNSWWYSAANNDGNAYPDKGNWIKLSKEFQTDSFYTEGDVIIYENEYYEYKYSWYNRNSKECTPNPNLGQYESNGWKKTTKEYLDSIDKKYENAYSGTKDTVMVKLPNDVVASDPQKNSSVILNGYDSTKKYQVGNYIKIEKRIVKKDAYGEELKDDNGNAILVGTNYYEVYLKVFDGDGNAPGSSRFSGWKLLENDYDSNSSYEMNDYVIGNKGIQNKERFVYFHFLHNILTEETIQEYINYKQSQSSYTDIDGWRKEAIVNSMISNPLANSWGGNNKYFFDLSD